MDKVAISTGGSMLVCVSLIYIGGFTYLYLHLLYHAFCPTEAVLSSRENENDNQDNVSYNLGGREDWEEYPCVIDMLSDSDSDSSTESFDQELYESSWEGITRDIETFRKSSNFVELAQESEYPVTTQTGAPLHRKTVKFAPFSREHSTFSDDEYRRKNSEYIATAKKLRKNPELFGDIYKELRDFKDNEMEVLSQIPRISDSEQKKTDTGLIFELDC